MSIPTSRSPRLRRATRDQLTGSLALRSERAIRALVVCLSVSAIVVLAAVSMLRLRYPYELEWMEGTMVDSVARIASGHALYDTPSLAFIPTTYNPIYFYISAALSAVFGVGFATLRAVSVLSTFGILLLLSTKCIPRRLGAGVTAAGVYAASFRFAGAWMDIAKTDSLALLFLLTGVLLGRDARRLRTHLSAAICYTLAYYTKQSTAPVALLCVGAQLLARRPRAWTQAVSFVGLTGAAFLTLDWQTTGWYSFYTFDNVRHFLPTTQGALFVKQFLRHMWPAMIVFAMFGGVLAKAMWRERNRSRDVPGSAGVSEDGVVWTTVAFAIALIGSTFVLARVRGTYANALLPACLGFAVVVGLAFDTRLWPGAHPGGNPKMSAAGLLSMFRIAVGLLTVLQFAALGYNPVAQVPTTADRAAGDEFVESIRQLPGDVLIWSHGYYTTLAGKRPHLHRVNYVDTAGVRSLPPQTRDNQWRRNLVVRMFTEGVQHQIFDWVVVDKADELDLFSPYYVPVKTFADERGLFVPVTGRRTRPVWLLKRNAHLQLPD